MRITPSLIYTQLSQALAKSLNEYATLNQQLSTNRRILAPSDDPGGMGRAIDYNVRISENGQYNNNSSFVSTQLTFTSSILQSAQTTLSQIRGLATKNAGVSTIDPTTQGADAQQAASLRDSLLGLANEKFGGQYLFSGFKSDTQAYAAGTYNYQGDAGVVQVPIDKGSSVAVNVPGSNAFSATLGPEGTTYTKQINGGLKVHYTQDAGTTINVEIRQADDVSRPGTDDTFSFSNIMQMTDLLSSSIQSNNTTRIAALMDPLNKAETQLETSISDIAGRVTAVNGQSALLTQSTTSLESALSSVQDANTTEVIARLQLMNTTISAIENSAGKILSQSLLDFLK